MEKKVRSCWGFGLGNVTRNSFDNTVKIIILYHSRYRFFGHSLPCMLHTITDPYRPSLLVIDRPWSLLTVHYHYLMLLNITSCFLTTASNANAIFNDTLGQVRVVTVTERFLLYLNIISANLKSLNFKRRMFYK